ncbi:hypothetical protein DQ384_07280 [Sphaerisporangium album]|uniref:Uncharacterized protein n=1 Tax=Sphaerisporangium album TaxID=509200 RepID=A0A367FPH2_9ACTN|nr:hypothetical protein [Sphaerisporangium album]RCG32293.1 hypothetical protein DQ384_07280 [Sphaerisporangium album]
MARFVMRVLLPLRVRRAVLRRFDGRYVTRADHRQDVRDALWEVQALKREIVELRREVELLRRRIDKGTDRGGSPHADPALTSKIEDAHRLAGETAAAVDHLLQTDVLLWQAVEQLREQTTVAGAGPSERSGS